VADRGGGMSVRCTAGCQAVNALAVIDDNKLKLVESGVVADYVQLLSPQREETLQAEAAHGLWLLAFNCKDNIIKQPGCVEGRYFVAKSYYFVILWMS